MSRGFLLYWKLDGKLAVPCDDHMEWALWFESADRRVAWTRVGPLEVSTVFIGLDHNFPGHDDQPHVFETMIFDQGDTHKSIGYLERYSTWEEAEHGHDRAVAYAEDIVRKANADIPQSNRGVSESKC